MTRTSGIRTSGTSPLGPLDDDSADRPAQADANAPAKPQAIAGFGRMLVGGAFWAVIGFGASQVIRVVANLILTRILFPEAFGIMALVVVIMQGIAMLSDAGLRGSVIYHKDGDNPEFLDTVWTIQVIRGFVLWIITSFIAYPFAYFYEEPWLTAILPVAGLLAVIQGFLPTNMMSANRHLNVRWLTMLELSSGLVGALVMIVLAWTTRSLWSLVVGTLVTAVVKLVQARWQDGSHRDRFRWNRDVAREVIQFGRWILISSLCSYVFNSGDRLVLGRFLTVGELGVYSIAAMMARLPVTVAENLRTRVMQPLYARSLRQESPRRFRSRVSKTRLGLLILFLPYSCLLYVFGQEIIDLLYDPRYTAAGWMTSALSLGAAFQICSDVGPVFQAQGDSRNHFFIVLIRSLGFTVCVAVGGIWAGAAGVIYAMPASTLVAYPFTAFVYRRNGAWLPLVDLGGFGLIGGFMVVTYGLRLLILG